MISRDAERRAERAELALIQAEGQLDNLDHSLNQRDDVQQQLIADHKQVDQPSHSRFINLLIPHILFITDCFGTQSTH